MYLNSNVSYLHFFVPFILLIQFSITNEQRLWFILNLMSNEINCARFYFNTTERLILLKKNKRGNFVKVLFR